MIYIIKFEKIGRMAYISHLDMLHQFLRSLRIVGIKPSYSNGFNPHPKISVALPLSLGFSSNSEFLEIETESKIDSTEAKAKLNTILPDGLSVLDISVKDSAIKKTLAALVSEVRYEIISQIPDNIFSNVDEICKTMTFNNSFDRRDKFQELIEDKTKSSIFEYLSQDSIITSKYSKKKNKMEEFDIKPYIKYLDISHTWARQAMYNCVLSTKQSRAINPLVVLESFYNYNNSVFNAHDIRILRTGINFQNNF